MLYDIRHMIFFYFRMEKYFPGMVPAAALPSIRAAEKRGQIKKWQYFVTKNI